MAVLSSMKCKITSRCSSVSHSMSARIPSLRRAWQAAITSAIGVELLMHHGPFEMPDHGKLVFGPTMARWMPDVECELSLLSAKSGSAYNVGIISLFAPHT